MSKVGLDPYYNELLKAGHCCFREGEGGTHDDFYLKMGIEKSKY